MKAFITVTINTSLFKKKIDKVLTRIPMVMEKTVNDIMNYLEIQTNLNLDQRLQNETFFKFAKSIYMKKTFRKPVSIPVNWAGRTFEATR